MGISHLWKLLEGSEEHFSLEELAHNTISNTKTRGLRVAVDVALWIFQSRSSVVGDQSELRSLFFRFNRLYELGIRPVFVFDGPNRPGYKRNKHINTVPMETEFRRNLILMIRLFNFAMWEAYGEAEAECAMLQRLDFVDVVLTGDSDVFLFGARRVIRQWPSKRHEKVPCYELTWISDQLGLDRSDLILIALLRGSDYDTAGTKGIGIQVAAQLAKCCFHRQLMDDIQIAGRKPLDDERVQHLFDDLTYELQHNSTKNLKRKHTGVVLDPKFPDFSIVTDFIHPLTNIERSDDTMLKKADELKSCLDSYREPDWINLASFAQHAFKWHSAYLLKRFSTLLFQGYMSNRLRNHQKKYTHQRKSNIPSSDDTMLHQTVLEDHYKPASNTTRLNKQNEACDVSKITGTKVMPGDIQLYRVEWDRSCWEHFNELLKVKLDMDAYKDLIGASQVMDEEEPAMLQSTGSKVHAEEKDVFDLVKRQWVDAVHVHKLYPSIALAYQARKRKSSASSQTKADSFLILPPRRNRSVV